MDFAFEWILFALLAGLALMFATPLVCTLHPLPIRRPAFDSASQLPTPPLRDTASLRGPPAF